MTWGYVAIAGATLVGGYMSSQAQKDAAESASKAQSGAANAGVEEQRRQFEAIQNLLKPYSVAGTSSLAAQGNLMGLAGPEAQKAAIASIANGPEMAAYSKQAENAILQNASATGGLRGGNVQGALAQYRPQMLSQLIQQRYSNLGGITSLGQNAAAMTGNAGMQTASNIGNLLGQSGAAQAGSYLASAKADSQYYNNMTNLLGMYAAQGNQPKTQQTTQSGGSSASGGGSILGGIIGGIGSLF